MINNTSFNPREHLLPLKRGKGQNAVVSDYLPVQWRLVWFRNEFPEGSIETEVIMIDLDRICEKEDSIWNDEKKRYEKVIKTGKGLACFKATVRTGQGGSASATGSESAVDFGDFIEKAETKAIGRALAGLGFGTQFAPELNEGRRIVDAPVDLQPSLSNSSNGNGTGQTSATTGSKPTAGNSEVGSITEQQKSGIRKLCKELKKTEPEGLATMSDQLARSLISQLSTEYRQQPKQQAS